MSVTFQLNLLIQIFGLEHVILSRVREALLNPVLGHFKRDFTELLIETAWRRHQETPQHLFHEQRTVLNKQHIAKALFRRFVFATGQILLTGREVEFLEFQNVSFDASDARH